MSNDKVEIKSQEMKSSEGFNTVDVEMKLMEVGPQKYSVDMKQNGESRFFCISESSSGNYRNRIVVPMNFFSPFSQKIMEVLTFASTYNCCNVSEKKYPRDRTVFAKSTSCFSPGGRRYYFDLVDAQNSLTLHLSYVFNRRRDRIRILVEALPNLAEILEEYHRKYPSLTVNDDYPANNNFRRRLSNKRSPGGMRMTRGFSNNYTRGYQRPYRPTSQTPNAGNGQSEGQKEISGEGQKRSGALRVLADPAPATLVSNAKKFLFEVVEGTNTFLRISEAINDNFKSSLHIPIEVMGQLQSVIIEMNKKYASTKSSTQSGVKA